MAVLLTYCILTTALLVGSMCLEMKRKPIIKDISFMDRYYTEVIKGIAILFVVLSHVGNANRTRLFAPGGGVGVASVLLHFLINAMRKIAQ